MSAIRASGSRIPSRRALAAGEVEMEEWTNFSMVLRLHAARLGVPFLPAEILEAGDLAKGSIDVRTVTCPYTGRGLAAIPALQARRGADPCPARRRSGQHPVLGDRRRHARGRACRRQGHRDRRGDRRAGRHPGLAGADDGAGSPGRIGLAGAGRRTSLLCSGLLRPRRRAFRRIRQDLAEAGDDARSISTSMCSASPTAPAISRSSIERGSRGRSAAMRRNA